MDIKEKFESQPWASALNYRKETFAFMADHVEKMAAQGLNQIIETGTARTPGNWAGDGQSTLIWDWLASEVEGAKVTSIDISQQAVDNAREQTNSVKYVVGDSIEKLGAQATKTVSKVALLYLDSLDFDWGQPNVAAEHSLKELLAVWDRLPSGCLIVVDDCHSPYRGKQTAIASFMANQGISPAFSGFQTGWIKP